MNFNISGAAVYFRIPDRDTHPWRFPDIRNTGSQLDRNDTYYGTVYLAHQGPEGREYIQTAGSGRDAGRTGTEVRKK